MKLKVCLAYFLFNYKCLVMLVWITTKTTPVSADSTKTTPVTADSTETTPVSVNSTKTTPVSADSPTVDITQLNVVINSICFDTS